MEENGVWRTVAGRRIFIRDGESLSDSMKRSGKFKGKISDDKLARKKTKLDIQTEESDEDYAKRKLKEAGDNPIMKRAAERKLKEIEKKNSNNEDDSYAYKKNWSKEDAEKYIASQLKNNEGHDSVLLEKNGHYAVAKNWKEAEDAIKQGWKHEKEDVNKIRKMAGLDKSDDEKKFSNGRTEKTYEPKKLKNEYDNKNEAIKSAYEKQQSNKGTTYEVFEKDGKYYVDGGTNESGKFSWLNASRWYRDHGYNKLPDSDYKNWMKMNKEKK